MSVNKVIVNDSIKLDLTADTVTVDTLKKGFTAHNAAGDIITGELEGVSGVCRKDNDKGGVTVMVNGEGITIDGDVTEGSSNAVSGGGVFTAIKAVKDSIVSTVTASIESIKTAIGAATKTADGLMTAADKTKLDGIAEDAGKVTLIDNLTTTTAGLGALDAHAGYSLAQDLANGDLVAEYANAFALRGTNVSWQDKEGLYYYEGADTSTYNIPYAHCFVLHFRRTSRGVAICLRWANLGSYSTNKVMWVNGKHDNVWTGWKAIG